MHFRPLSIPGAALIEIDRRADSRGFFARTFCEHEFADAGLPTRFVQSSVSHNVQRGTLRGMHYQAAPYGEGKLVRCTRGKIYDVALDLRRDSPAFGQWEAVELTANNHRALYIPTGCAHGFQTLENDVEVLYLMTEFYMPTGARGVRWNDPAFRIAWPITDPILSDQDTRYPDFQT